jgi:SAM-dependent MidA family methyltransferase
LFPAPAESSIYQIHLLASDGQKQLLEANGHLRKVACHASNFKTIDPGTNLLGGEMFLDAIPAKYWVLSRGIWVEELMAMLMVMVTITRRWLK